MCIKKAIDNHLPHGVIYDNSAPNTGLYVFLQADSSRWEV